MSRIDESGWDGGRLEPANVDHPGLAELLASLDKLTALQPSNPDYRATWMARCPAHDDKKPSLSVGWLQNGRITIKCFAGCTRDSVLRAAGIDPADVAPPRTGGRRQVEATYDYADQTGTLVYQVCRFAGKEMRYRQPDGKGGWRWRRGSLRVLYRLPELIEGVKAGEKVFICEGEKDTDRLAKLGLCATCNPGGAGKWDKSFSEFLAGADVVLLQDNDEPGARHVQMVARGLRGIAKSIRVVLLPELPPKGDVSDWLDAGHTRDDLMLAVDAAPALDAMADGDSAELGDEAELKKYVENKHGLWRLRGPDQAPIRLANFTARIVRQIVEDDGIEQKITLEVTGTWTGRTKTFFVSAAEFGEMRWPGEKIDARAAITPFTAPREVAYVVKLLSREMVDAALYTHTGWRELEEGTFVYLHAGGAIGPNGLVPDVRVRLDGPLSAVSLPIPPTGEELRRVLHSALDLLQLAPRRVMIPLLAAPFRAPLGPAGFSIHLFGPTGVGKTQLAVLIQQFFGAQFNWDRLPTNWISTANAIEGLLFRAKDMVAVCDDFNPRGAHGDVQRMHQTADRVFRSAANIAARGRLDRESDLRPVKPPRAFLLSTGEEAPTGHSLAARILLVEIAEGEVDFVELTRMQTRGRAGDFAACMSAFLQFHAREYAAFADDQAALLIELRGRASREGYHRRSPDAIANGMLGWRRFLDFAEWAEAITVQERAKLEAQGWEAFDELASLQNIYQAQENQTRLFVALVSQAVQGELAHLSTFDGEAPADWASCGWRREEIRDGLVFRPTGPRIGFVDGDYVYLIPNAAYKVAQDTARGGTHLLSLTGQTLAKRLAADGLLFPGGRRGGKNFTTRRKTVLGGKRQALWKFERSTFGFVDEPEEDGPTKDAEDRAGDGYAM